MRDTRILQFLAQTVTLLLHPIWIPLYLLVIVFHTPSLFAYIPAATKWYCYLVTVISLQFIPLLCLPILRYLRVTQKVSCSDKHEGVWMLLITILSAFFGFWLLKGVVYTEIAQRLYLILILMLAIFAVIVLKWNLSLHLVGMGCVCSLLLVLGIKYMGQEQIYLMLAFALTGLLGTSLLYLSRHAPWQIYVGFLYGFFMFFFLLY